MDLVGSDQDSIGTIRDRGSAGMQPAAIVPVTNSYGPDVSVSNASYSKYERLLTESGQVCWLLKLLGYVRLGHRRRTESLGYGSLHTTRVRPLVL